MKLILALVVTAIIIFSADSRDFPDKPDEGDLAVHPEGPILSNQGRNEKNQQNLRGKSDKKSIKNLTKKLGSLDEKLTQAISETKMDIQNLKSYEDNITDSLKSIKDDSSKLNQATSEIMKNIDSLKASNAQLTKENSGLKAEVQSIKDSNSKLIQANSKIEKTLEASTLYPGGVFISGQYLTFSTEALTWAAADNKCKSLGGRLATLNNPQAFHSYMNKKFRGQYFWIGGSDQAKDGTWVWTNGQTFSSFPWGHNEPNGNTNENCLDWGHGYNYNDYACSNAIRYVCEHGYN